MTTVDSFLKSFVIESSWAKNESECLLVECFEKIYDSLRCFKWDFFKEPDDLYVFIEDFYELKNRIDCTILSSIDNQPILRRFLVLNHLKEFFITQI